MNAEIVVERAPRRKQWQQLDHARLGKVAPALKRALQERQKFLQFIAIAQNESTKTQRIFRRDGRDGLDHAVDIRRRQQLAPGAKDQPVLRVETGHGNLTVQVVSRGAEDLPQHPWIQEESWPNVKLEAVLLHRRSATTHLPTLLDDRYLAPGLGQKKRRRKASGSCPHNDYPTSFPVHQ